MDYEGMTALVTGASAGLGEAFAREFAKRGSNLVLVARTENRLRELAESLRETSKVNVTVIPADLASSDSLDRMISEVKRSGVRIDILVNNAGFGIFEDFLSTPLSTQMNQLDVNVRALVTLTHAFAPAMVEARRGGIINIASNAAFQPLAGADVYAASKAFVLFFSEGLSLELKNSGVRVIAACPGPMATRFFANMRPKMQARNMDQPSEIVNEILSAFEKGKRVVVPGKLIVRLGTLGARLMPRNAILNLAAGTVRQLNQR